MKKKNQYRTESATKLYAQLVYFATSYLHNIAGNNYLENGQSLKSSRYPPLPGNENFLIWKARWYHKWSDGIFTEDSYLSFHCQPDSSQLSFPPLHML